MQLTDEAISVPNDKTNARNTTKMKYKVLQYQHDSDRDSTSTSEDNSDDDTPFVAPSNSVSGSRKWDKYHYCLFCGNKEKKLLRHLRRRHGDESQVAEAMVAEETCNQSKASHIWRQVKNLGNHEHNKMVVKGTRAKDLVVWKRPKHGTSSEINQFVPCSDCFGYFNVDTLWVHRNKCAARNTKDGNRQHVKSGRRLLPMKHDVTTPFRKILDQMIHDDISLIIKGDKDILSVGQNLLDKSSSFQKGEMSRERMRVLAKVLQGARSIDTDIKIAADMVKPRAFNTVVLVTRQLTGYDSATQQHSTYSNALRINYALKDLALCIRSEALKSGMDEEVKQIDNFLKLRESDWHIKISASALRQRNETNWRKPHILPLTEDCVNFNQYLQKTEKAIKQAIDETGMNSTQAQELCKVTLTQLVFFNRRRPREVEMLECADYTAQMLNKRPVHDEVAKSLSISEKVAMDRLSLLMVRGKRGRGVPILVTDNVKQSIDMLIDHHSMEDTMPKYVFARQNDDATTPVRACDAIRELASQASLKHPENLRCTKLRKHVATLSQLLNLKDNELEQLANHMGHNISVHREYYRLPQETVLLAKMSKLLSLTEKGELHQHCGKSLEDIELTPEDQVEVDKAAESDSDSDSNVDEPRRHKKPKTISYNEDSDTDVDSEEEDQEPKKTKLTKVKYNKWGKKQETFLFQQPEIKKLMKTKATPGKITGLLLIQRSKGLLRDKTWMDIKNKIHNINRQEKKNMQRQERSTCKGKR